MAITDQEAAEQSQMHYGWVIALTGMAVAFACLGLGRFALGMLLPSMGKSLGLSYAQMGLIGTGNFVGYMAAVALTGLVVARMGARRTIFVGLILVGGSMVLVSRSGGFAEILTLYVATGFGSGFANVALFGMISIWFLQRIRGRAAGVMLSGNGVAIVFAGLYVPYINSSIGVEGWRTGWLTMGMISLAVAILAVSLLRNSPAEKGLPPMGNADSSSPLPSAGQSPDKEKSRYGTMVHLGLIYTLFGATYVVYATFIVTTLVDERGYAEEVAGTFWAVVGALSVFSGPLFGWVSDRLGRKTGMIVVYCLFTLSYTLVAVQLPAYCLYLSIAIFGLTVWSIPSIMAATVGDYMGPLQAAKAFGFVTLFFGAGQIVGPAAAGYLADAFGSFRIAFGMCAGLTATAAGLTLFLKRPGE